MPESSPRYDYLFVSDLHVALGYDPERRAYHPREDFFFDAAFFRWLQWSDAHCAAGRRWELVFVGDAFDFLPVDLENEQRYFQAEESRWQQLDPADREQVAAYWQQEFGAADAASADAVPEWVQWLFFEDDLAAGRVQLEASPAGMLAMDAGEPAAIAPPWAVDLHSATFPPAEQAQAEVPSFAPQQAAGSFRVTAGKGLPAEQKTQLQQRQQWGKEYERRYGFLPTPGKSMARLYFIYRGHPLFFRALAWFVGRGHRVVFVKGNHDLELYWPAVQSLLRRLVAREYAAAFDSAPPPQPDLNERIDFRPSWFYYRRGLFYAEHGNQYEPFDSVPNLIRPILPHDQRLLNVPVASPGVTTVVARMEDEFPEWENRGKHAVVLWELVRRFPHQALVIVTRHARDFLWMAQRLWRVTRGADQQPTPADLQSYADMTGLPAETLQDMYDEWDLPLMLRPGWSWFLFSPAGHVLKGLILLALAALVAGGTLLWYLVAAPLLASLIPDTPGAEIVGAALQLLGTILLWLLPPLAVEAFRRAAQKRRPGPFLLRAARRIHAHLQAHDPELRFLILGHDHRADVQIVARRKDRRHVYYLNTGCWFPEFAEGTKRLQKLGRDVEFTFVRLVRTDSDAEAELLRWNDEAGRAERYVTPLNREFDHII
ncbi:MAG: hypothetical protein JW900_07585 [Anaerolineae bacterium]|nr:hypothetical protein [Anaerolineae bacterium]